MLVLKRIIYILFFVCYTLPFLYHMPLFFTFFVGEKGKGNKGKDLTYKGSAFHRVIPDFMLQVLNRQQKLLFILSKNKKKKDRKKKELSFIIYDMIKSLMFRFNQFLCVFQCFIGRGLHRRQWTSKIYIYIIKK